MLCIQIKNIAVFRCLIFIWTYCEFYSIRSESQKYEKFFSLVKENYNVKWIDLYNQCIEGYEKKGIGYIRYYRDYDTGIIKGYLMIEYQSPLLINNFTHIKRRAR